MGFCSSCGASLVDGSAFCASCGAPVAGRVPGVPSPTVPSTAGDARSVPPRLTAWEAGPSPGSHAADRDALRSVIAAAILALVAGVVGLATLVLNNVGALTTVGLGAGGGSRFSLSTTGDALIVVGVALGILELLLWRDAFRILRAREPGFATPASLATVAIVGVVLALVGLALLLIALGQLIRCAGPGNVVSLSCARNIPLLVPSVLLVFSAAIVALVGYVGVLIGIWRLGSHFAEPMFKVGAVLLLVPFLSLVGSILLLVAARSARHRFEGIPVGAMPSFPHPP